MTWLTEQKKKKAAEEKERKEKAKKEDAAYNRRMDSAKAALKDFVSEVFDGVKKDKKGNPIKIEFKKDSTYAYVSSGDEPLINFHFWYKEEEEWDRDGCSWGNGKYYLKEEMQFCRKYKPRYGYAESGEPWTRYGIANDEELSHYLLQFLK